MFKVIIADDEVIEIEYLHKMFRKHSEEFHVVGTASNGEEVLRIVEETNPDVIILDICMPGKDGLEVAEEVKRRFPDICVILNTAFAEFEFARKAIEYQVDAYLLKPASETFIIETIKKCLKKKKREEIEEREEELGNQNLDCVINYIERHYNESISLKELANIAHFSPTYLSRMFNQEMRCTLCNYVNKKRIDNAKRLLIKAERSIQEIAMECGFINISHFNRVFKNLVGKSPMEYKKESEK
ncbi:response regulator transcription factor [Dorea phocaeensis]|uniref:response regulator transcription factor n=1 Tax=Dorea phocaeensis TaxID=2040291 RepID=UPI000C795379|nr:response regulator [Dorea phocaeensis]